MSSSNYDVIVLGLGGMGSSAAYHLASRGLKVLGLERHPAVHDQGSSHGHSRVIRQAYFEDPAYVPLLLRAYELWERLEKETDRELMTLCGGIMLGPPDSVVVSGSIASAREYNLEHEILTAPEIRKRYPVLHPSDSEIALFEKKAGWVHPEETVRAHLDRAAAMGAELHFSEPVTVTELAAAAELTVPQLDRAIKRALGLSAKQLLLRMRLEEALLRLRTTQLPVAQIASECGYYDQSAFTRQFRRVVGMSPGAYRSALRLR